MRFSERMWKKERIRRLTREATELRETLALETSRREGLQQDLLAMAEERDAAKGFAARAEEAQAAALDRVGMLLETRDRVTEERDQARRDCQRLTRRLSEARGILGEVERLVRDPERTDSGPGRADLGQDTRDVPKCGAEGREPGYGCTHVKGHAGPHSWERSPALTPLGPGPGRDR